MHSLEKDKNQCISPVSIINVIAMLGLGAKGTTKDEINRVLQPKVLLSGEEERNMHTQLQLLNGDLSATATKANANLDIANALFIGSDDAANTISADFTKAIEKYDGKVFRGSKDDINQWVSNKTHKKISELLKEDPEGELTLINAVYFKDEWLRKFDPKDTIKEGQFHISLSETVKTPLMNQQNEFKFIKKPNYKAIKLPFKSLFSLIAVLPDKIDGLQKLATELPHEEDKWKLLEALYADNGRKVDLTFPKFTMESEYDLNGALCDMGMETAFTPRADFTGITPVDLAGGLRINKFIHKTYISVDEEGAEAAAASAACLTRDISFEETLEFKADHPFQFMIVHDDSKTILFDGLFTKPTD